MSAATSNVSGLPSRLGQETRRGWVILCLNVKKLLRIDGAQWAGAFAFNAFFSLFPLTVLLLTVASSFVDRDRAARPKSGLLPCAPRFSCGRGRVCS
jgi:hypothetical protein